MAVGLLQLSLLDHFQEDVFKTSWALSIFLGLFSISGQLHILIISMNAKTQLGLDLIIIS